MKTSTTLLCLAGLLALARAADPSTCTPGAAKATHYLAANTSTVHWGYFFKGLTPKVVVNSGDEITVEMITHHAGDDPDKMIKGDKAVEGIYEWGEKMGIDMRGASGAGDGVHVLTGPIYMCGAEAGDVLQIDILDLIPRVNPGTGKTYGSNAAAWWGYQYRVPFKTGSPREVATIYEVVKGADGKSLFCKPDYQFTYGSTVKYAGPKTGSCIPTNGSMPMTLKESSVKWTQSDTFVQANNKGAIGATKVPCVEGAQQFTGYGYPGLLTQHPTGTEDYSIRGKFKIPVNIHIGAIGLAPSSGVAVNSIPPMRTGGNMDNRRIGAGATLYLPVENAGALLMMGDAHMAQGDSELDGTGIETSVTGKFKLTLHKKAKLPALVKSLEFPLVENANEYIVLGYAYADYLKAKELAPAPQNNIFSKGADLNKAMTGAYTMARDWLMSFKGLTEDQAITLLTTAGDFQITQVVDGNWGVHVVLPKFVFDTAEKGAYKGKVECGSSMPR